MALKIAFMGTPEFAVPLLARLIAEGHAIAAVYTRPPRPKGRGLTAEPSPVAKLAASHGLEIRTPATLRHEEAQRQFAALGLDAAVVAAYGLILPKPVLEAPRLGCFNLHASLLPRWRGAAPIQRAVMAGDAETGVMAMRMDEGLDTGPILMTDKVPIGRRTAGELTGELARVGASLMARTLAALEGGGATETPQAVDGVTYAKKILKNETHIDWTKTAHEVDCLIRALSPAPGAWTEAGGERLKILYADPHHETPGEAEPRRPGEVLDDRLTVACGEGAVRLVRVQRAGKSPMGAADLLRGFALPPGTRLNLLPREGGG